MMTYSRFATYTRCPLDIDMPEVSDAALDRYLLERYIDNSLHKQASQLSAKSVTRTIYYHLRPLFPVAVRKHLQRLALRNWNKIAFPSWPIDTTVDDLVIAGFRKLLQEHGGQPVPFIWFWPRGYRYAAIMTHDVESSIGRDLTKRMMAMEAVHSIGSSFEIVPEVRYEVSDSYLDAIRGGNCEVCLHGLNHDGRLFDDYEEFSRRVERIRAHGERFRAIGFRSPVMYRNLDWLPQLPVEYDMSVPNTAHLDPQRGGCCTVMPYFIGALLELPLTTIQDYSLLHILNDCSLKTWRQQAAAVRAHFGLLTFLIHPDYITTRESRELYRELLTWLASLRETDQLWLPLPRDVNDWWRRRANVRIERQSDHWVIRGPDNGAFVLAFARLEGGRLQYALESGEVYDT